MRVNVAPVSKARWQSICNDCAGAIDSLVELLQGQLSPKGVMERVCRQETEFFPTRRDPSLVHCPDRADMCKHIAAVLYGRKLGSINNRNCCSNFIISMLWN